LIDYDRFSALSSPSWLAGLGLALAFLFGIIGGFSGFAVALALALLGQSAMTIKQASGVGLITATLGMILGSGIWARLTWGAFREITGIGESPFRQYGRSRVIRKEEHATGYHMRLDEYDVHPKYWEIMAARVVGGQNLTHRGWKRYFGSDEYLDQFIQDMMDNDLIQWINPDNHRSGLEWTDKGIEFWRAVDRGEVVIE
jgi:hypothetical protein